MPIRAGPEGKITTIEPQIATETRNIRGRRRPESGRIPWPGMFTTTTIVLPDKPPVITVPETAVDYTLAISVYLLNEKKEEDGKTSLTVTRTFVQTGKRVEGRAEILKADDATASWRWGS
jgi:multidrug efflux system membrane fusion protein